MNAAIHWLMVAALCGQNPPAQEADPLPGRTEQLKLFKEKAAEVELRRGPDAPPLALTKEPVLRYSNAEREIGSLDGATFVWLEGARPVAVVSFSVRRQGNSIYRECTSLSN